MPLPQCKPSLVDVGMIGDELLTVLLPVACKQSQKFSSRAHLPLWVHWDGTMESKDSDVIGDHSSEANSGNLSSSASKSSGGPRLQLASRLNLENRHVNSAKVLLLFLGLSSIGASIAAFSRVTKALNEDAEEKVRGFGFQLVLPQVL